MQFFARKERRRSTLNHVGHVDAWGLLVDPCHLVCVLRRLDKKDVCTNIGKCLRPVDRFIEPLAMACIGARENHDVRAGIACINCRLDAVEGFLAFDNELSLGMAAAFGSELILDHDGTESGTRIHLHRTPHIQRVAVTGIAIADHRDWRRRADVTALVEHLAKRDEASVRGANAGSRNREPRHEAEFESSVADHLGAQCIPAAGYRVASVFREKSAQLRSL